MDAMGNKELLYRDPSISCISLIRLKPRPTPPIIAELCQPDLPAKGLTRRTETGGFGVVNVNDSNLAMPNAAEITGLRIWQIVPRSTPIKERPRTRLGDNSGPRTCLGTVPVEARQCLLPSTGECAALFSGDRSRGSFFPDHAGRYVHQARRASVLPGLPRAPGPSPRAARALPHCLSARSFRH